VAGLQRGGPQAVTAAVRSASELPRIDACRDADLLARAPLPPVIDREQIALVRDELARATAPRFAGEFAQAVADTREITERIDAIAWAPLTAEARLQLGALLVHAGELAQAESTLQDAYFVATSAGALELAAEAAGQLVHVTGYELGRHREGSLWARHELTALTMLGDTEGLRMAAHLDRKADIHLAAGEYDDARRLYAEAMAIREAELGAEHPSIAQDLVNRANVDKNTGAYADARELFTKALAITEQSLGPDHPELAAILTNLSHVELATGHPHDAEAVLRRALDIRERALGRDHVDLVPTLLNLGAVRLEAADLAAAEQLFRRALAIAETDLGADHPYVGAALSNLALTLTRRGASADAAESFARALAIQERSLGPDHPDLATSLYNLAGLRAELGDYVAARALFERALAIDEKALGPDHRDVADVLLGLAELALLERRWADGLALAERAVGIYERGDAPPEPLANALFVLARARWSAGRTHDTARATARRARDLLAKSSDGTKLATIDLWLAARAG
jgi:tetratricopeptide (TPR) repeat protein